MSDPCSLLLIGGAYAVQENYQSRSDHCRYRLGNRSAVWLRPWTLSSRHGLNLGVALLGDAKTYDL